MTAAAEEEPGVSVQRRHRRQVRKIGNSVAFFYSYIIWNLEENKTTKSSQVHEKQEPSVFPTYLNGERRSSITKLRSKVMWFY